MVEVLKKEVKRVTSNICHCTIYKNDLSRNTKHVARFCSNPHALISSGILSCTTADLRADFGDLLYLYVSEASYCE